MYIVSLVEDGDLSKTMALKDIEKTVSTAKEWFNLAERRGDTGSVSIHFQVSDDEAAKRCVKASINDAENIGVIEVFAQVGVNEELPDFKERVMEVTKHLFFQSLEFVLIQIAESISIKTQNRFA